MFVLFVVFEEAKHRLDVKEVEAAAAFGRVRGRNKRILDSIAGGAFFLVCEVEKESEGDASSSTRTHSPCMYSRLLADCSCIELKLGRQQRSSRVQQKQVIDF